MDKERKKIALGVLAFAMLALVVAGGAIIQTNLVAAPLAGLFVLILMLIKVSEEQ